MSVLILTKADDTEVNRVIDWLCFYEKTFYRCSFKEFINSFELRNLINNNNDSRSLKITSKDNVENISAVWFRRDVGKELEIGFKSENSYFSSMLKEEMSSIRKVFWNPRKKDTIIWLSSYSTIFKDKIKILEVAKESGLDIPNTLITNNKIELEQFINSSEQVICKANSENLSFLFNKTLPCMQYVKHLSINELNSIPNFFFPTLFQEKIEKDFDIRVFYLNGECFSMAIFNSNTDFRENYRSNRNVPINLPIKIEKKITRLMLNLELNTGSIDIVKSKKDMKYYFLEINPNGQFSMISNPCNYYLEKKIAKYLCYEKNI